MIKSNFHEYKSYHNGSLRLKSWDFASMLGLTNMIGTLDLWPYVNQP